MSDDAIARVCDRYRARRERSPSARLVRGEGKNIVELVAPVGEDGVSLSERVGHLILNASLGSTDRAFSDGLLAQLASGTTSQEGSDPEAFGLAMAVVQGIER